MSRFAMSRDAWSRISLAVAILLPVIPAACQKNAPPTSPAGPGPAVATPTPGEAPADPAADLYGDTGGEAVLAAAQAPQAPLRARKADSFFKLTNPRFESVGKKPFPFLAVDYERLRDGYGGVILVVRTAEGQDRSYIIAGPMADRAGTLEINLGFGGPGSVPPKNGELYLLRQEHRYGNDFRPNFKVSNSVVLGQTKFPPTLSRAWTADEAARLRQPPFELVPGAHADVGEDTAFAGDKAAGHFRYVLPGKPMIGIDWGAGEWDKEPCIGGIMPVYERKQPSGGGERLLAKEGYAVGGLNVRAKRFVDQVQIVFLKLLPDGKLDPKDSYTSEWLGPETKDAREVKLGGDGRPVIGIHCSKGAILNGVALVMGSPGR